MKRVLVILSMISMRLFAAFEAQEAYEAYVYGETIDGLPGPPCPPSPQFSALYPTYAINTLTHSTSATPFQAVQITSMATSPDGQSLYIGPITDLDTGVQTVGIISTSTNTQIASLPVNTIDPTTSFPVVNSDHFACLAPTPDGQYLCVGIQDDSTMPFSYYVRVWDLMFPAINPVAKWNINNPIQAIAFSQDSKTAYVLSGENFSGEYITFVDVDTGTVGTPISLGTLGVIGNFQNQIAVSQNGNYVYVPYSDGDHAFLQIIETQSPYTQNTVDLGATTTTPVSIITPLNVNVGNFAFVQLSNAIYAVDTTTNMMPMSFIAYPFNDICSYQNSIAITPDGNQVYVGCLGYVNILGNLMDSLEPFHQVITQVTTQVNGNTTTQPANNYMITITPKPPAPVAISKKNYPGLN